MTVLRSGRRVVTAPAADADGRETRSPHDRHRARAPSFPRRTPRSARRCSASRASRGAGFVEDVSASTLRRGEILGFFGLVGAGRSEVAQMLFGITQPERGEIRMDGRPVV